MKSARHLIVAVFAVALAAGAAWAGSATTEEKPAASTTHVTARAPQPAKAAAKAAMPHVDLNSATKEDLMKLPGVDEAIADKIIAARPFKARSELRSKKLVSRLEYAKLRQHVVAKPTTVAASTK